jgi:salicylate hydroxylase
LTGFDLVVGADGIRSLIRRSVLGQEVNPEPTGLSAYRVMIKASDIEGDVEISAFLNPRDSCTTMVMGYDCRLIMGPARNGEVYNIVAMVPDGKLGFQETLVSNLKQ